MQSGTDPDGTDVKTNIPRPERVSLEPDLGSELAPPYATLHAVHSGRRILSQNRVFSDRGFLPGSHHKS